MNKATRRGFAAFGVRRSIGVLVALAVLCAAEARGQVLSLGNAEDVAAALKNWYPGITFQRTGKGDERDRVIRIVCGAPMTIGDSPRDAAEAWLGQFAEVFGVTEPELEFAWERPMRERQDWKVSKTVLRYRQTMQGIPVDGSDVRVMTTRPRGAKGPGVIESVAFVEGVLLPRPERGLEPWVSAAQALNIARELRPKLVKWSEARLSVVPVAPTHAKFGSLLSWMLEGTGPDPALDELLCIDAHTGELIHSSLLRIGGGGHGHGASAPARTTPARGARHEVSSIRGGANEGAPSGLSIEAASNGAGIGESGPNDITGTVTAWRIPNWYSDTRFIVPTPNPPPSGCYRDPVESLQAEVKMELLDSGGTTVLDTAFTDENGDYILTAPSSGSYKVRATLAGRNWTVVHWDGCGSGDPDPVVLGPVDTTAGSTGVDFEFGSSAATAQEVADAIAHEIVRQLVDYWDDPMSEDPIDEPFLVWTNIDSGSFAGGAFYDPPSGACPAILSFGVGIPSSGQYVHWATPTIIAHEFGHHIEYVFDMIEFPVSYYSPAFGEGYADATAAVFIENAAGAIQPTVIGPDMMAGGCTYHLREPLVFDPCFPVCYGGSGGDYYKSGMLLAVLWIETRAAMGFLDTRALFSEWTPLAVPPGIEYDGCQPCSNSPPYQPNPCYPDESARSSTLVEVLVADDDDEDLNNGTPNDSILCAIYGARNIGPDIDIEICKNEASCEENVSQVQSTRVVCDLRVPFDIVDALCFFNAMSIGGFEADLNSDGQVDALDCVIFVRMWTENVAASQEVSR